VGISLAGQDVENDVGGVAALCNCLGAGRLDGRPPVADHRGEDIDHLPIAIIGAGELRRMCSIASQHPVIEGSAPLRRAPGLRASAGT
jgi:hypothetical protein